ncbi:MAG: hypothetical protein U1F43_29030 [Myxococcota bacterium]
MLALRARSSPLRVAASVLALALLASACASDGRLGGTADTADATATDTAVVPDISTPDEPGRCDLLACQPGSSCVDGACVDDGASACQQRLERVVLPDYASFPQAVAADGDVVAVASALGLELYAPTVGTAAPEPLGAVELDGVAGDVALHDHLAAVAHGRDGVALIDIAAPSAPRVVAEVPSFGAAVGVALSGDRLVVSEGAAGLSVWDVSAPESPALIGTLDVGGPSAGVAMAGDTAYVAAHGLGLAVVDLAAAPGPSLVATLPIEGGDALRVRIADGRAWVAASYAGVVVFDLTDPAAPIRSAQYYLGGNMIVATDVAVDVAARRAYVADFWRQLTVLDLTGPGDPTFVASYSQSGYTHGLAVAAGRAWVAADALEVFDVEASPPALVHALGRYHEYGNQVTAALADDGRVLIGEGSDGVALFDAAPDGTLTEVGRYASIDPVTAVAASDTRAFVGVDTTQPFILTADLQVVDIAPGHAPALLGTLALQGRIADLASAGDDIVYAAAGVELVVIDVADPAHPARVASLAPSTPGADQLDLAGDLLAVSGDYRGVTFYDVSDRRAPVAVGSYATGSARNGVALLDGRAFVAVDDAIETLDLADPSAPAVVARFALSSPIVDLAVADGTLWVEAGGEVLAFDARGPGLVPLAAAPSPARTPTAVVARGGAALVSDTYEAVTRVTLACTPIALDHLGAAPPTPGVQWVDLALGADALGVTLASAPASPALDALGYSQATPPRPVPTEVAWFAHDGAPVGPAIRDLGDELVVATGKAAAPRVVRARRMALPAADQVRVRVVDASPGAPFRAALRRGTDVRDLGTLTLGQHAEALDLPALAVAPVDQVELWVADDAHGLAAPLPVLAPGHAYDLVVAPSAESGLFALVVRDDGLTQQVGSPAHATRLRVANLTPGALDVALEGEPHRELARVPSLETSHIAAVWSGSRHLVARDPDSGAVVFDAPVLPLAPGVQTTFVIYRTDGGALAGLPVADFSGHQTGAGTELQLVHAATGVGPLDVTLSGDSENGTSGTFDFADALALGQVSPRSFPPTGSYDVALDLDRDGRLDRRWQVGYFPDYGFNVFIAKDGEGRLRIGTQSPADDPIYWRYARDEIASVRVMNLTGRGPLMLRMATWYEPDLAEPLARQASSYVYQVRAGEASLTLADDASGEAPPWTWRGTLAGASSYTVVFWQPAEGPVASLAVRDAPLEVGGAAVRFINLADGRGPVTASCTPRLGGVGVPLGHIAPGTAGPQESVGDEGGATDRWIRVTPDGGGAGGDDDALDFALGSSPAYRGVTNVFWVEDATWPYLVVQGVDYLVTELHAEELQARLRIVYLPTKQSALPLRLDDGPATELYAEPTYGAGSDAFLGRSDPQSLVGVAHVLHLGADPGVDDHPLDLPAGTKSLVVISGDPDDLRLTLLDETDLDAGAPSAHVFNTSAQTAGVYTLGSQVGAAWTPLVTAIAPGELGPRLSVSSAVAHFGVDWGADGEVDWSSFVGGASGHTWLILTPAPAGKPYLLVLQGTQYPWIGGELLP